MLFGTHTSATQLSISGDSEVVVHVIMVSMLDIMQIVGCPCFGCT